MHDAGYDTSGCAPSVPFEVKLPLEGLVDRFDDVPQRLEQGCARPFPFTFTGRPQQLDSMLGHFAFDTTAEVVLVADESLPGAFSQKLAFGCQDPVDASYQTGGLAQPLVAAGLLGQAGEEVAQVGTGMAELFGLGGVAGYGLHRGEGDQFGIAQAGRNAGRRAPRRRTRAEIAYARSLGKPVRFTHPEVDHDA